MNSSAIEVTSEIQSGIRAIEENTSLFKETNFTSRTEALDFIDFHIIDRIEGLLQSAEPDKQLKMLKRRAGRLRAKLEEIDSQLFKQLRENISTGIYDKSSFREMVSKYMGYDVDAISDTCAIGYNNLDVFINGLLSTQVIPSETKEIEPEMVFFQKTPVRVVFKMVELARLSQGDVFFDLGSGLGQVAIMTNLISGASAVGVEYEPAYCNYAKTCASQLNLHDVEFTNADARNADYSQGTVFFMYTPFGGGMLQDMLKILQMESVTRTIKIFTYGPCSPDVAKEYWLNCFTGNADDPYQLCGFKSIGVI